MKSSIFIPKVINVGYQKRSDTYTQKLAYVIYYDESGKLRKETSWQSWRNKDIPNNEFDNVPTEGFVLNKKVGDYSSGWNHRQSYIRVYDPRNFEFEITVENLLYILENTSSIKGKGLEGEFVYGWDGKDLILIPIASPDYKEIQEYNSIIHNKETIKAKDLIIGATYLDKNNTEYIYMGKYDTYESVYIHNKEEKNNMRDSDERWKSEIKNVGKRLWFASKTKYSWESEGEGKYYFYQFKTISKKFIKCKDSNCHEEYAELFDKMENNSNYSPVDDSKDKYESVSFDDFKEEAINDYCWAKRFVGKNFKRYEVKKVKDDDDLFTCYMGRKSKSMFSDRDIYEYDIIPQELEYTVEVKEYSWNRKEEYNKETPTSLEKIYEIIQPQWLLKHLENGKLYDKRREY